jgi:predicted PurR-regulated permease PerM
MAQGTIIPIVLGVLISYALDPIVTAVHKRFRIPRAIGAAVLLMALVGATGYLIYGLRFEGAEILKQLPAAAHRIRERLENGAPGPTTAIKQVQQAANELQKAASAAAPPPSPGGVARVEIERPFDAGQYLMWGSMGIAAAVGQAVLILFLAYFLLASGDLYKRKLVKIAGPSLSKKKITVQILDDIDRQIERFLFVQVLTSVIVAIATWIAFRSIGLQEAAVWGVTAGVFNTIPYFGPVLVSSVTAGVGFVQFDSFRMALLVGGVALAITSVEGFLLTPWLTSRASRMNAVAIFVGLLFWGWVWDVWGMLLAVPMLMVVKAVCDHVEDFKGIGELLGD